MPLQKIIISPVSQLYLWHVTEDISQLKFQLRVISHDYLRFKNEIHQKQNLAKQLLISYLKLQDKLNYLPSGKPVLSGGQYISISHSGYWVGISLSRVPVGLDLQTQQNKLLKVAPKFVHKSEQQLFDNRINTLQYIWTAKESIYKLAGQKTLSLKNDIRLLSIDSLLQKGTACLQHKKEVSLFFNKITSGLLSCQAVFR